MAFPFADYYGGSVALALSGCRQSRILSIWHVLALLRPPTHLLTLPRWYVFHDTELPPSDHLREAYHGIGFIRLSDGRFPPPS